MRECISLSHCWVNRRRTGPDAEVTVSLSAGLGVRLLFAPMTHRSLHPLSHGCTLWVKAVSALGHLQPSEWKSAMSALPPNADMLSIGIDCFFFKPTRGCFAEIPPRCNAKMPPVGQPMQEEPSWLRQ